MIDKKRLIRVIAVVATLLVGIFALSIFIISVGGSDNPAQTTATTTNTPTPTPTYTPSEASMYVGKGFEEGNPPTINLIKNPDLTIKVHAYTYWPDSDIFIGLYDASRPVNPAICQIDPEGKIKRTWEITNKVGGIIDDVRLLPGCNLLFSIYMDGIYEITYDGQFIKQWDISTSDVSLLDDNHIKFTRSGSVSILDSEHRQVWLLTIESNTYQGPLIKSHLPTLESNITELEPCDSCG